MSVIVTKLEDLFSDAMMTAGADSCSQGGRREWTGQTEREPRHRAWSDIRI